MDANALRQMGDFLRDKAPDVVAVLASANGEKITFLAVCGPEAVKKGVKAGDLVKSVCAVCGGEGDPQGKDAIAKMLRAAGAVVADSNFESARLCAMICRQLGRRE